MRTEQNEAKRAEYQKLKAEGICPRCRKRKHAPMRTKCQICLNKEVEAKNRRQGRIIV